MLFIWKSIINWCTCLINHILIHCNIIKKKNHNTSNDQWCISIKFIKHQNFLFILLFRILIDRLMWTIINLKKFKFNFFFIVVQIQPAWMVIFFWKNQEFLINYLPLIHTHIVDFKLIFIFDQFFFQIFTVIYDHYHQKIINVNYTY